MITYFNFLIHPQLLLPQPDGAETSPKPVGSPSASVVVAGAIVVPTGCRFHLLTVLNLYQGRGDPPGSEGSFVEFLARLEGQNAPFGG